MAPTTSIREVAARAGVSVGTVSNVLNRPDLVTPSTRERVQSAISDLGFVRNESARQLRLGRSRTIGLVVLDVANPFFTDVARGAEDAANEAGVAVILCNSDESPRKEAAYLDVLEEQRVRGVLISPVRGLRSRVAQLRERGIPVVLVDRRASRRDQCSVSVDDVLGGDIAVTHLLEQGHERIGYICGPFTIRQDRDRHIGALRALDRAGRKPADLVVLEGGGLNVASGREQTRCLLDLPDPPRAVFCANDLLALGALQEAVRGGVRVPDDLAIVGYDDIEFAAAAAVPLTSVRQPRHELGATAARLLIEEADQPDDHVHQRLVFEPSLVVRESSGGDTSGAARTPHPGTARRSRRTPR
ncbi:MAG: substrate-binding domain-containing protein [Streptosporangiales bacterium]|nr:substrate-binding domain-containing protein [Streptosporangiales bacterium]